MQRISRQETPSCGLCAPRRTGGLQRSVPAAFGAWPEKGKAWLSSGPLGLIYLRTMQAAEEGSGAPLASSSALVGKAGQYLDPVQVASMSPSKIPKPKQTRPVTASGSAAAPPKSPLAEKAKALKDRLVSSSRGHCALLVVARHRPMVLVPFCPLQVMRRSMTALPPSGRPASTSAPSSRARASDSRVRICLGSLWQTRRPGERHRTCP